MDGIWRGAPNPTGPPIGQKKCRGNNFSGPPSSAPLRGEVGGKKKRSDVYFLFLFPQKPLEETKAGGGRGGVFKFLPRIRNSNCYFFVPQVANRKFREMVAGGKRGGGGQGFYVLLAR